MKILTLFLSLGFSFAVAAVGGFFQPGEWYEGLRRPSLTPPGWVFPVVWTILYFLMGLSASLVWQVHASEQRILALGFYLIQMVFNGAWSWLFFGLHRPGLALCDILLLWSALLITTVFFWKVRPLAGGLMFPYLIWVTFAVFLNFEFWRLNR